MIKPYSYNVESIFDDTVILKLQSETLLDGFSYIGKLNAEGYPHGVGELTKPNGDAIWGLFNNGIIRSG